MSYEFGALSSRFFPLDLLLFGVSLQQPSERVLSSEGPTTCVRGYKSKIFPEITQLYLVDIKTSNTMDVRLISPQFFNEHIISTFQLVLKDGHVRVHCEPAKGARSSSLRKRRPENEQPEFRLASGWQQNKGTPLTRQAFLCCARSRNFRGQL